VAAVFLVFFVAGKLSVTGGGAPDAKAPVPEAAPLTAPQPVVDTGARTEAGATAAAVEFLTAYGSSAMYDADLRRQIVADVTSPAVRTQTQTQVDAAFTLAARSLGLDSRGASPDGQLVARTIPVGARVVAYAPDRAVVAVWTTGLLGVAGLQSPNPVQESWSTETITLDWTPVGWRWASLEHADGPAPIGSAQVPADADAIARAARDFGAVTRGR
jgi:hypothetical protein